MQLCILMHVPTGIYGLFGNMSDLAVSDEAQNLGKMVTNLETTDYNIKIFINLSRYGFKQEKIEDT